MVSLENEYFNEKQMLKNAKKDLAKLEALNVEMTKEEKDARNRGIKNCKENIKESEELIEEIREELVEFINNGGEVSEKTKKEINYFEQIRVDFKIVSNKNENIYVEGYVEINDEEAEDVDWYFWDGSQYSSQRKIHHDEIEISGSTVKQENEIAEFESNLADDGIGIDDYILQSEEEENRTYQRENLTVIINEGAKFELEFEDYNSDWDCQYYMAATPKFNGQKIKLNKEVYLQDPYTYDETQVKDILYENKAYIVEIPKEWWEDPKYNRVKMRDEIIEYYTEAFEQAYRRSLAQEIGIFGIAANMYEERLKKENSMEVFNESGIQDYGNAWEDDYLEEDLWTLTNITSEDIEQAIKNAWAEEESLRAYP